jgi:hypothetical protein
MAERFVEVDRSTPMLLPADLREWVPEDDLVHFVIEAVKTLPTGEFVVKPSEPTAKGKWIQPGCQKRSQDAKSLKLS